MKLNNLRRYTKASLRWMKVLWLAEPSAVREVIRDLKAVPIMGFMVWLVRRELEDIKPK